MSRLAKILITSLSVLLIGAIAAFVVLFNFWESDTSEALSIDEMNQNAYETPEITTDLSDGRFVRIQFKVITEDKKGFNELEKREFQIKNILIKELAVMETADFQSGISEMEETLQSKLNELMEDGKVAEVYTTSKILQ